MRNLAYREFFLKIQPDISGSDSASPGRQWSGCTRAAGQLPDDD